MDKAVQAVLNNPEIGEQKRGDLATVRVYKCSLVSQPYLLAYHLYDDDLVLLTLGSHENFYRDLKRNLS